MMEQRWRSDGQLSTTAVSFIGGVRARVDQTAKERKSAPSFRRSDVSLRQVGEFCLEPATPPPNKSLPTAEAPGRVEQ